MRIQLFVFMLFCCMALSCNTSNKANKTILQADNFISNYLTENKVPGMQVAVSHKGKLIYSKGFGFANIELNEKVTVNSKFRIASVSKPITAVLTARLHQNGLIDVDHLINFKKYGLRNFMVKISLRQLICHAAGIRHYLPKDTLVASYRNSLLNGLKILETDTLLHKPGSQFHYSSYGYNLVGAYLEKTIGKSFENLLADSLFNPLQMNNSTIDHPYRIIKNRTAAYELINNEIENARFFDNRYKTPSGGLLATAEDLAKFGNELIYGNYLNRSSKQLLFEPYQYTLEKESDTGFGWVVTKDESGNKLYGHLGGITGGCSAIIIYPDSEFVFVWLGNRETDWSEKPILALANIFIENIN